MKQLRQLFPSACIATACAAAAPGALASDIEDLRGEIEELRSQLDATVTLLEEQGSGTDHGHSADASTLGGYGELHYNNLDSGSELDFHRFVLFFGHRFSDRIRFASELELEHALAEDTDNGSGPGAVELEQAVVEFDITDQFRVRGGLFLVPVGILNETHEPPTFYGAERNPVEKNIIPTTWWEGGAGLAGELAPGLAYDVAVTSGLKVPTTGSSAYKIRNGRQKVAEASAESLAYTAKLAWTGLPGVELAGSVQYQEDITQGAKDVSATLYEVHAVINQGPFGLRALYAAWNLDGNDPKASGRNKQNGWYVEPSWKPAPKVGLFARYSAWDNEAGSTADTENKQTNVGVNFWPHEQVVLKADLQHQGGAGDDDGFNLGVGYYF
ncbi:MAG TPA: porin [Gammaproteobacteria bacterium]|nr:porin [Gammaproteobacteria bacterium]